jgi:hypothetical protein
MAWVAQVLELLAACLKRWSTCWAAANPVAAASTGFVPSLLAGPKVAEEVGLVPFVRLLQDLRFVR